MKATQRQILKAAFIAVLAATALTPVFFPANSVYFAFIALVLAIIIFEGYSFWLEGRLAACMAAIPGDAPAEECEVAKFRDEFKEGPQPGTGPQPRTTSETVQVQSGSASEPAKTPDVAEEFFSWGPREVAKMKRLIEKCGLLESHAAQRDALLDIRELIGAVKGQAGLPELRPVWQMAGATEGLVKQLTSRPDSINQSTLRTIAGGIELMEELCAPGIRPGLATNPAIKILAVDDDPLSRSAVSAAVQRVFDHPDLAENGKQALELIQAQVYDLIILDIMMPDMDGLEVFGRFRRAGLNRATPVLFVTALRDFETRIQMFTSGGGDLIGKPFITFEIAVKALTLIVRNRLRKQEASSGTSRESVRRRGHL